MIDLYNTTVSISPASCFDLQLIALFCMFLLILSVPSNSILVIALCSKKHLKKPYNILLFSFSLICLFGSVSELPIVIISNWECGSIVIYLFFQINLCFKSFNLVWFSFRWVFGDSGCQITAFVMCFTGVSSAYLVTFMAFERSLL